MINSFIMYEKGIVMDIIEILKAIVYGIVQGVTEWLPISSTGHLILSEVFIPLKVSDEFWNMFLVLIQLGSILAVITLFFHKLNPFSPKKNLTEKRETWSLWFKVAVGCIPAAVAGFLLDDFISAHMENTLVVAITLILYGVLFIVVESVHRSVKIKNFKTLSYKTAFLIGAFQMLALIPGTSRSGATILGAMILGTSRYVAAEYSFFLAIPVMFGASGLKVVKFFLKDHVSFTSTELGILVVGMLVSFLVSLVAIKYLMNFIKKHDFKPFGYYRIALGIIVIVLSLLGVVKTVR